MQMSWTSGRTYSKAPRTDFIPVMCPCALLVLMNTLWDALMAQHHYLGFKRFAGRGLRYVFEWRGQWAGPSRFKSPE